VAKVVEHPPQARGDPATDIVVCDDRCSSPIPAASRRRTKSATLGEGMTTRADLGIRREVAVHVEVDRARDVPAVVRLPPLAGPTEVPAAVDDRTAGSPRRSDRAATVISGLDSGMRPRINP
jgi:hypothetical protein